MSVINQALKKAQRQQLVHSLPPPFVPLPQRFSSPRRRLRGWRAGGLLCGLGLLSGSVALYGWLPRSSVSSQAVVQGTSGGPVAVAPLASLAKPTVVLPVQEARVPQPQTAVREASVAGTRTPPPGATPEGAETSLRKAIGVTPVEESVGLPRASASRPAATLGAAAPAVEPVAPEELLQQALQQQETGNVVQAKLLFEQVVARDPTAKAAYNSLGNLYYQQEQYERAATMYERALSIDPSYVKARNNLGNTYMRLRMDHRALAELQQALNTDGTYGLTYYNLACFYARSGNGVAAARYLQQAIEREPQARDWAQNDTDFKRVRATREIVSVLGGVR